MLIKSYIHNINKKFCTRVKKSMVSFQKVNSLLFLEVKLISENPYGDLESQYFLKNKGFLIQKLMAVSFLVY